MKCANKGATGANKSLRNLHSCSFILCFTVSVTLSINTAKPYNDFIIFIISLMCLVEINEVNCLFSLIASFLLIFLSNLFIAFEVRYITNPSKLSLAKGIVTCASAFFSLNLTAKSQKIHLIELMSIFDLC